MGSKQGPPRRASAASTGSRTVGSRSAGATQAGRGSGLSAGLATAAVRRLPGARRRRAIARAALEYLPRTEATLRMLSLPASTRTRLSPPIPSHGVGSHQALRPADRRLRRVGPSQRPARTPRVRSPRGVRACASGSDRYLQRKLPLIVSPVSRCPVKVPRVRPPLSSAVASNEA
jgi:hypothetical protein